MDKVWPGIESSNCPHTFAITNFPVIRGMSERTAQGGVCGVKCFTSLTSVSEITEEGHTVLW